MRPVKLAAPVLFLSTLSLRRATQAAYFFLAAGIISIHALLAESDIRTLRTVSVKKTFLSTLSLRRATSQQPAETTRTTYFYPRSPCGERHETAPYRVRETQISIHALLAESDEPSTTRKLTNMIISIHALLAESDSRKQHHRNKLNQFLSTLSLRRATHQRMQKDGTRRFLSTLSLRRAT